MYWRFSLQHPAINSNAWTEVEEPVGWDDAEITLARDSRWHGINVEYSLPVKFYGAGYNHIKAVFDNYLIDTFIRCRVEHRTPDGTFQTVFEGRLNLGGCTFSFEDGLYMAEVNLEQDGNVQTLMSRMDAKVDLRSRTSLDSPTPNDLPAYTWADYLLKLLPQVIISRNFQRYGFTAPYAYDAINIIGTTTYSNWLHDPIYVTESDELGGAQDNIAPFQSGIGVAYPLTNRSPVFKAPGAFSTIKLRIRARYRVEVDDNGLGYDFHPIVRYNTNPNPAPALVGGTSIWTGAYVAWMPGPSTPPTQTYTYDIDQVYDTPAIASLDYVFLNFGFGAGIVPPGLTPTGSTFSSGQNIRVFQEAYSLEILDFGLSPATQTRATLVHEALARMAESLTGRQVTAVSNLFGRVGANASQPLPAPANANGDGHNLALSGGLQIRQLPTRPDGSGTPIPTQLSTSLKQLLENLNAVYNIGWALEPVPVGATLPTELAGTTQQVLRVEHKRYFYQKWPVVKVLQAIREYELKPLEKELYTRVEAGYDKFETESLNGLEEFNTRWEFQSDVKRSESTLSIRCNYIAGGYIIEKQRRIDPLAQLSTDSEYDNDVFFIATAKSSGTHFDGELYAPLTHSERAENCTPDSAFYAPDGNLIDGRRAYNLRLAPQRNLIRWLPVLFAALRPLSTGPLYRMSKVEGNRNEFFRLTDGTLDNEDPVRMYSPAGYDSGDNLPWYDTVELTCQYPCSWEDYLALKANPYSPVQVTDSGPADGFWWLREVNYEPAQGLARWRLLRARPDACLGVEPVFTITTATTLIELTPTEESIEFEAFLNVPFTINRTCCDSPVTLTLVQGPDPEQVEVTLPANPVPSPFNVRFTPLVTVETDTPFTLELSGSACGTAGITVPGIIRRPPFAFVNAWTFDGVNDYISVPGAGGQFGFGSGDFCVEGWVYLDAAGGWIMENFGSDSRGFNISTSGNRFNAVFYGSGGPVTLVSTVTLTGRLGTWIHVLFQRVGTTLELYEDNVLRQSAAVAAGNSNSTTSNLFIGSRNIGGVPQNYLNGRLDEWRIYNRALTSTERAAVFNSGLGNFPPTAALPSLRAHYRFDTAAPTGPNFTLADSSGNGNNGTSSGISVSPLVPH